MDIMNLVDEEYQDLSLLFKMFSDKTRLKILVALVNASLSVNALAELLDMSQSAISHQLATLKQMRLVRYLKKGKQVYYSLADDHIVSIIKMAYEHILE
ncbi:ArsR family transcriptional regulator [Erysipelotrichaceae bacterium OH741_COT-311]|nr:ArsR family transcriptional regulator [Erysipelotrichaceae bacterium OH741_COT-311]